MNILSTGMSAHHMNVMTVRPKEGVGGYEIELQDDLPAGFWELKLGSLREQSVISITKPSASPLNKFL